MLTRCKKCKSTFYRGMEFCPECGARRRRSPFERRLRLVALLAGILTLVVVVHLIHKADEVPPTPSPKVNPEAKIPAPPVPMRN